MERTTVRKFKWFWLWQDEAKEAWLREMSNKGYHLFSVGLAGIYTFVVGEPQDYVYRMDYQTHSKKDKPGYLQFFRDVGWEHISEMSGWQYFRKEAKQGESPEIFTDVESKVAKYKRVLVYLAICSLPMWIAAGTVWDDNPYSWWGVIKAISLFALLISVLLAYAVVRLALRIRQLSRL